MSRFPLASVLRLTVPVAVVACLSSNAFAIPNTAAEVLSYHAGGSASNGYQVPAAALGGLREIADPLFSNSILSPFNPPYLPDDLCIIGAGGELTLQFARPVVSQPGSEIGVFSNNGLIDIAYPTGQNDNPAGTFSDPARAIVSVSFDGANFVSLGAGPITFDNPSNFYADLGADPSFSTTPGIVPAAIDKPFIGNLSSFNGLDWNATKSLLNGSAGGTWLDLAATGLASVRYVRFSVPVDADYRMVIDAVSGAKVMSSPRFGDDPVKRPPSVPEPTTTALIALTVAAIHRRPRSMRSAGGAR